MAAPQGPAAVDAVDAASSDWAALGYVANPTGKTLRCLGQWTSLQPDAPQASLQDSPSLVLADRLYHDPVAGSELSGHVELTQPGRHVEAERMTLDAQQRVATASGGVLLTQHGLTTRSQSLTFDLQQQSGRVDRTRYAISALQAHGEAAALIQHAPGQIELQDVTYTTCDPVQPAWRLRAARLSADQAKGRAVAQRATLRVNDVPVLSVPWLSFPIDERRSSGVLQPRMGYTNSGGIDVSVPYYFNLAPNYDVTLTPRLLSDRGLMLEGEGRWLTPSGVDTLLRGGWLPDDRSNGQKGSREQVSLRSLWRPTPVYEARLLADHVSDKDYFADLGNDPLVRTPSFQERSLSLLAHQPVPGLEALLRVQDFEVVDQTLSDEQRPYRRLPQLLVHYGQGQGLGWRWDTQQDVGYFKKSTAINAAVERNGVRLYQDLTGLYRWQNSWAHVQPSIGVRHLLTHYDQASQTSQGISRDDATRDVWVPQVTVDAGLVLERSGRHLQVLEPRLFYVHAPYRDQRDLPSFDTVAASFSYSQLFSPYRFVGHDRLEDNHFVSLGLTHRLFAADGTERIRTSVGQQVLLDDPRVRLDNQVVPRGEQNGPALDVSVHLSEGLHLESTTLWQRSGHTAQSISQLVYNDQSRIYQLGWFDRRQAPAHNQQALHQATLGLVQPINSRWRLFGSLQYDISKRLWRDNLLGADYDSCCMRVSLYGRRYYNDLDDPRVTRPRHGVMAEVTLKGLGGLSGNLAALLRQKVIGYSEVENTWNTR